MESKLNNHTIRNSEPKELAKYLRSALQATDSGSISTHLLAAVASESLPSTVFSTWLSVCVDLAALDDALRQEHSILVRKLAIDRFGKLIRTSRLQAAWSAVGGTQGLLHFLAMASVNEVKRFSRTVGRSGTSITARRERQGLVTELLKALAHEHFPETKLRSTDGRPLLRHYANMVPAGTPELVVAWMSDRTRGTPDAKKLMLAHPDFSQERCRGLVFARHDYKKVSSLYFAMLSRLPPYSSDEKGVSQSMAFSIQLLRDFNAGEAKAWDGLLNELAVPLVRRLWRRRCLPQTRVQVLDSVLTYLQKYPEAAEQLHLRQHGIWDYAVRMWSQHPQHLQAVLIAFMSRVPTKASEDFRAIAVSLERVVERLRLPLLRLLLQHLGHFSLDLESDEELKRRKDVWPAHIFLLLAKQDARVLLERLLRLRPEGDFLDYSNVSHNTLSIFRFDHRKETTLLLLYLFRTEEGREEKAETAMDQRRKKAATSREQADRAYWAKYAVFCAIASGSQNLYAETLLWVRRYNKDALTVKELYSPSTVQTPEGIDLLCGVPERSHSSTIILGDVEQSVKKGNEICLLLLDTACMGIREPSFSAHDWTAVCSLMNRVVQLRLNRVNKLQTVLGATDTEIYSAVWNHTIETALALEKMGHQDGHQRIGFNRIGGPSQASYGFPATSSPSRATLTFVDELAKQRNDLWQSIRKAVHPDVVTLREPWPRGLPIQLLLAVDIMGSVGGYDLPYLLPRAEKVVFVDPAVASVRLENANDVIGPFSEDWKTALRLYVNAAPDGPRRQQRAELAWDHALSKLSDRLLPDEAVRFWQVIFGSARIDTTFNAHQPELKPDPSIPVVDGPVQPTEWNPDPDPEQYIIKARRLSRTVLDCMLNSCNNIPSSSIYGKPHFQDSFTVAVSQSAFFDDGSTSLMRPSAREALIAAALLYINSKRCASHRLLSLPFPTAEDARFPSLYLDQDFLERQDAPRESWENDQVRSATRTLMRLKDEVPPTLLLELTRAMFAALKGTERPSALEHDTFALLKVLAKCDRSMLALDLIKELVLDRPGDSSWHRHLLTEGLFNGLTVGISKSFLTDLSSAIKIRLEEQSRSPQDMGTRAASSKPAIKITTVKMLAQMMADVDFVDESFAAGILTGLFAHVRHLDIRVAIVESLLRLLADTHDDGVKASIFAAFERHAVPIVAAVNERHPLSEEDWEQAERTDELPEVYETTEIGPVLRAMLNVCQYNMPAMPQGDRRELVTRILLPMLKSSAANNRRWTDMFLRKHGISITITQLPAVPVRPSFLTCVLLHCIEWMPASAFDLYADFIATLLDPPQWLSEANEAILQDTDLRSSNAGKQWLSIWHNSGVAALSYGGMHVSDSLKREWKSAIPAGVTCEQVRHHVLRLADIVILKGDVDLIEWSHFQRALEPRIRSKEKTQRPWYKHCRPVVEQVIQRIDNLRTTQWQHDLDRSPACLPDTFPMRLWLLTYPSTPWLDGHAEKRDIFSDEVSGVIDQLASSQNPYHEKYQQLKGSVMNAFDSDYAYFVAALGSSATIRRASPVLADYLRIELADSLIQSGTKPKDTDTVIKTKAMLLSWKASPDEVIRMRGLRTLRLIMDPNNEKHAWLRAIMP